MRQGNQPPRQAFGTSTSPGAFDRKHPSTLPAVTNFARNVGEPHRPGSVHRLDRDVSGVMIAAKTEAAYEYLKNQFADHKMNKEYTALVLGAVAQPSGTIKASIGRNRKGKMSVKSDGLSAVTHFEVLRRGKKSTLLKITTETGRMHQIRVHMKHIGHPIVGDTLYAPRRPRQSQAAALARFAHRLYRHVRHRGRLRIALAGRVQERAVTIRH